MGKDANCFCSGQARKFYGALTTRAHYQVMKNRGHSSAVNKGPERDHVLLAAFLEATNRIDRRALQRSGSLIDAPREAPKPVNLEANPTSRETHPALLEVHPVLLEVEPTSLEAQLISTAPKAGVAPFTFRRANLVRA